MKLSLSIPDELVDEFDKVRGLVPRSTLIQELMQLKIEEVNGVRLQKIEALMDIDPEPESPEGQELHDLVDETVKTETALYGDVPVVKSNCKNCGHLKLGAFHDFIYGYEMERITDWLCESCWKKAVQDGSAR